MTRNLPDWFGKEELPVFPRAEKFELTETYKQDIQGQPPVIKAQEDGDKVTVFTMGRGIDLEEETEFESFGEFYDWLHETAIPKIRESHID